MVSNCDCWFASPCSPCHIVRGATFPRDSASRRAARQDDLNDPDLIRSLTVSTRLFFSNKCVKISPSGRDLVGLMEKRKEPAQSILRSLISYYVVPRRWEYRIRALSARAVS